MERFTQHDVRAILEFLRRSYWVSDLKAFISHVISALPNNLSFGVASRRKVVPSPPSQYSVGPFEGDRLVLNRFRTPVLRAYRNVEATSRMREALAGARHALNQLHLGVIVLAPHGRVLFANARAQRCLLDYFDGGSADRLPKVIERWVAQHEARLLNHDAVPHASEPLVVEREETRLTVRLLSNAAQRLLLLQEQQNASGALLVASFGLTEREAEVLMWVAEGKTNLAVGTILQISARTVQKHLERTYVKLGVETRTAAAAQALRTTRDYTGLASIGAPRSDNGLDLSNAHTSRRTRSKPSKRNDDSVRDTALSWALRRSRTHDARIGRRRRSESSP